MKLFFLLTLLILTSCASVKRGQKFSLENTDKNNGVVYFYRPSGDWAILRSPDVYVNQVKSFPAANMGYRKIVLAPGVHNLEVKGFELGNPDVVFNVKAGKVYFLRLAFNGNSRSVYDYGKALYPNAQVSSYQDTDVTQSPANNKLYFVRPEIGIRDIAGTDLIE